MDAVRRAWGRDSAASSASLNPSERATATAAGFAGNWVRVISCGTLPRR